MCSRSSCDIAFSVGCLPVQDVQSSETVPVEMLFHSQWTVINRLGAVRYDSTVSVWCKEMISFTVCTYCIIMKVTEYIYRLLAGESCFKGRGIKTLRLSSSIIRIIMNRNNQWLEKAGQLINVHLYIDLLTTKICDAKINWLKYVAGSC